MAQTREFLLPSHKVLRSRAATKHLKTLIILAALASAVASIPSARAQFQQPLVFSSAGAVASRNDQTGALTPVAGSPFTPANQSLVIDVQGRFLFAIGASSIHLEFGIIELFGIGGDGLFGNVQLPPHNFPEGLWIDSTGAFLYVATSDLQNPVVVNIYSVNLQTGRLTATSSSPLPGFTSIPPFYPDPSGSFNYEFGADQNTAIAFTVDPQTGYFVQSSNSPFSIAQIAGNLTFSIPPGQQGISGPSAALSATNLSFGTIQTGTSSTPQTVTLTSNGGEALSVNSISLSGTDPTQFLETDTCQTPSLFNPQNSAPSTSPSRRQLPPPDLNKQSFRSPTMLPAARNP